MRIETKKIRDGEMIGEVIYVCHFNFPDVTKKPLRNLPPTRVVVREKEEAPKNQNIYYSSTFVSPIVKGGKPLSKVIKLVDNTGYRSYIGNEIHCFDNMKECEAEWNKQLQGVIERLEIALKQNRIAAQIEELKQMKKVEK